MNILEFKNLIFSLHTNKFTRLCAKFEVKTEDTTEGSQILAYENGKEVGVINLSIYDEEKTLEVQYVLISPKYAGDEKSAGLLKAMIKEFEDFYNNVCEGYKIYAYIYNRNLKTLLDHSIAKGRLLGAKDSVSLSNISKEDYNKWTHNEWKEHYSKDYNEMKENGTLPDIDNSTLQEKKENKQKQLQQEEMKKQKQEIEEELKEKGFEKKSTHYCKLCGEYYFYVNFLPEEDCVLLEVEIYDKSGWEWLHCTDASTNLNDVLKEAEKFTQENKEKTI